MTRHASRYVSFLSWALVAGVLVVWADRAAAQTPDPNPPGAAPERVGYLKEPSIFTKGIDFASDKFDPSGPPKDGFYPELGRMITGSGWISVGPGYRHTLLNGLALVDGSAAISWRAYKIAQARVEFRPLHGNADRANDVVVGSQVYWSDFTQVHYYGLGPSSSDEAKGSYRVKELDVVGYATVKREWVAVDANVGYLRQPTIDSPAGPFRPNFVDARALFPPSQVPGLASPPSYVHASVNVSADFRDNPGYSERGGFYRAGAAVYSDRDTGQYSFQRYDVEAIQFVPLVPRRWNLAVHGWLVGSNTDDGKTVPVYLLPSLGGHNTLRGYADYRFHDRNLLVASVESRWALMDHVDLALFFDAGNVGPRVGDLDFDKKSVGVGLRVHTRTTTFGRLDFGHSKEGWVVKFKLDDPFFFPRLSRRIAIVPFVP